MQSDEEFTNEPQQVQLTREIQDIGSTIVGIVVTLAAIVSILPTLADAVAWLDLTLVEKVLSGAALLFLFALVVVGWFSHRVIIKLDDRVGTLHDSLREFRENTTGERFWSRATLYSIAAVVLSGDNGNAWDRERHFEFMKIERTVDQRRNNYRFSSVYEGRVIHGPVDHIPIKFDSDLEIDTEQVDAKVTGNVQYQNGTERLIEKCDPIVNEQESGPYDLVLKLPFGPDSPELTGGDKFRLQFECEEIGESPEEKEDEVHIHFPLYRFNKVREFITDIKLPGQISGYQAAKIENIEYEAHRQTIILPKLDFEELQEGISEVSDGEFRLEDEHAQHLYVLRFVRA